MMNQVLIIAAHPDDEVLGCGGTIARLKKQGKLVGLLVLTNGEGSRNDPQNKRRQESLKAAVKILGIDKLWSHDFPDNELDTVSVLSIVKVIENVINEFVPDTVFTHSPFDLNQDHRLVAESTAIAARSVPSSKVKNVMYYEVPSSTEWGLHQPFTPNYYVELMNDEVDKKFEALLAYEDELRDSPHPRSLALLKSKVELRGSECGTRYAEAFQVRFMRV